jgi:hypothetical protein
MTALILAPGAKVNKPSAEQSATLTANADAIRMLRMRVANDVVEIGRRLAESREIVRKTAGHGHWLDWLKAEFSWSESTALNFIRVFEMSESTNFADLDQVNLPVSALYLLAAPSTPKTVRGKILNRAKTKRISVANVKDAVADAKANKAPKPTEAKGVNAEPPPDIVDKAPKAEGHLCLLCTVRMLLDELEEGHITPGEFIQRIKDAVALAAEDAETLAAERKAHYAATEVRP